MKNFLKKSLVVFALFLAVSTLFSQKSGAKSKAKHNNHDHSHHDCDHEHD